jgi:hypothetical protein
LWLIRKSWSQWKKIIKWTGLAHYKLENTRMHWCSNGRHFCETFVIGSYVVLSKMYLLLVIAKLKKWFYADNKQYKITSLSKYLDLSEKGKYVYINLCWQHTHQIIQSEIWIERNIKVIIFFWHSPSIVIIIYKTMSDSINILMSNACFVWNPHYLSREDAS